MQQNDTFMIAARRFGFNAAAIGVAMLGAGSLQARTQAIDGVRLAESQATAASSDPYQDGRALLAKGDVTGAIAAFRAALVETPQSVDALNGLAVSYDRMGRYDISRAYYDSALAIAPDSAQLLNNLGYSLFLQGKLQAAIPLLQKAVASSDPGAHATGQRVLNLIAAQMRSDAARESTELARAEVEAPAARVELSANGEQRLVFSAPAPDPELTARLGDAAPLVMVAAPWTQRDERALEVVEAARDHEAAVAAKAALAELSGEDGASAAAPPRLPPLASLAVPSDARRVADRFPTEAIRQDAGPRLVLRTLSARPANEAAAVAGAPAAIMPRSRSESAARQSAPTVPQDNAALAWLLASRRTVRPAENPATAGHYPQVDIVSAEFDSDDRDLNIFAARMRSLNAAVLTATSSGDEQAVANLQALLGKLRAA